MIDWLDEFQPPAFPSTARALKEPNGLLAAGGLLSPAWLDAAYRKGIFPWNDPEEERLWWTPSPRAIITPQSFRVPKRLAREARNSDFRVTANVSFSNVIQGCAIPREDNSGAVAGTWIDDEILTVYPELNNAGRALSIECWSSDGKLVGGFYGLMIGRALFGESMFSSVSGASKAAFAFAAPILFELGIELIDCQMRTDHLARFGILEVERHEFEALLASAINAPPVPSIPGVIR